MGIYLLVFLGGSPIGSPLIGVVSDAIGVRQAIAICGAVVSFGAGITFVLARKKLAAFDQDQKRNAN
jgi:MFS family permease